MIALDTNVLVRCVVRDDAAQARRAKAVIDDCALEGEACLVTNIAICELEWVLEEVYRASRADVAAAVRTILSTPPFVVEDAALVTRALNAYVRGKADLSDYLLGAVGADAGARTTHTFDRALRNSEGFTLL